MAYIETRASQLELEKPDTDPSDITTDDILDEIGKKSLQIWKIFVLTSFAWAVTAPLVMIGAFIDDSSCDYSRPENLSETCLERKSGSLIYEFSLISENSYLKHWFTSIFMWGNIVGGSVISLFSDRYGRRIVVVICLLIQGIACCLSLLVEDYISVLILRFIQGIFFTGSGVAVWILGYESIPSTLRPYATFTFGTTWVIGYCVVAPVKLIGNQYFNYISIGLIEIPAVAAGPFLLEKIGRKLTITVTHLTTSLAFTVAAFFFRDSPEVQLCLWLLAKFAIAAAFMCIFAYASESFPTQDRNLSIGICSVIGKLFGSSAPFIQTTAQFWQPLPLVIFGSFSAIAGLITLLLPETNHKQLPDTIDNMS